jgi:hypothetical protein
MSFRLYIDFLALMPVVSLLGVPEHVGDPIGFHCDIVGLSKRVSDSHADFV